MPSTLESILASQQSLIEEAAAALPHQFNRCTHSLGYIRQAVYLCLTCDLPRGICAACSIACHTDHEQVELFPKRHFRCDCPTEVLRPKAQCTLHAQPEPANEENSYGQNFEGRFCRCGRPYDARTERETMIQCIACEDWYHESCLNLREVVPPRVPIPTPAGTPHSSPVKSQLTQPPSSSPSRPIETSDFVPHNAEANADGENDTDAEDDASDASDDLPSALLPGSAYESFICASCVRAIPAVSRIAGTSGAMMVVRRLSSSPEQANLERTDAGSWSEEDWTVIGKPESADDRVVIDDGDIDEEIVVGTKRPAPQDLQDASERENKKARVSSPSASRCLAPSANPAAQAILTARFSSPISSGSLPAPSASTSSLGAGDLFLTEGWRMRWCQCGSCLSSLRERPYLLNEEETYEPPEDPDSTFSLEELGMRALQNLPRDRALDGIRAFNEMKDGLMDYLRPFATSGRVVGREDVLAFFEARREEAAAARKTE